MEQPRRPTPTPASQPAPVTAVVPDAVQLTAKGARRVRKIDCGERAVARATPGPKDSAAAAAQVCDAHVATKRRRGPGH